MAQGRRAPSLQTLFPALSEQEVWERVVEYWDLVEYSFPIPKFQPRCPNCWSYNAQIQKYSLGKSSSKTIPCRADVTFKCTACSMVLPPFGVPIPEEMHEDIKTNDYGMRWDEALVCMVERGEIELNELSSNMAERVEVMTNGHV